MAANKFIALGVQFKEVGGSNSGVSIQKLFTLDKYYGGAKVANTVDQIHRWTGMAWSKYYYNTTLSSWVKDGETSPSSDFVNGGETIFFRRASKGAGTLNLSGEVDIKTLTASVDVSANKFVFVAYPWPVQFPVNGFINACSKPWGGTKLANTVDQVHRWTGMAWCKYYYNSTLGGYVKDGETEITSDELAPGEGVFFRRSSKGACTLTFTKPEGL